MKHPINPGPRPAVWLATALVLLVTPQVAAPQVLRATGGISVERGFGLGELRSDNSARHGSVDGIQVLLEEAIYLESFHQVGDSSGIALNGDSVGVWSPADAGGVLAFFAEEDAAVVVSQITAAGAYEQVSDLRVKRDLRPVSSEDFLARLMRLDAKRYKFAHGVENHAKGGDYLERDHIGLIAQELEAVFPSAVTQQEATGLKLVDHHQLIAVLVEAVKALSARVEALEGARTATELAPVGR